MAAANKYLYVAQLAMWRRLTSLPELIGRLGLYFIILGVWWRIWNSTEIANTAHTPTGLLWYLMGTEWIVLSIPYVYLEIEQQIRDGDIGYSLLRPGHYPLYQLAQAMGIATANWLVLGVVGVIVARFLTGAFPAHLTLSDFVALAVCILLAVLASCFVMVSLGLIAVWTLDASPCAWVYQKLQFVGGGLMLPLAIYPQWLNDTFSWTPFPYLLGHIIDPVVQSVSPILSILLGIICWMVIFAMGLWAVHRLALAKLLRGD